MCEVGRKKDGYRKHPGHRGDRFHKVQERTKDRSRKADVASHQPIRLAVLDHHGPEVGRLADNLGRIGNLDTANMLGPLKELAENLEIAGLLRFQHLYEIQSNPVVLSQGKDLRLVAKQNGNPDLLLHHLGRHPQNTLILTIGEYHPFGVPLELRNEGFGEGVDLRKLCLVAGL